MIRKMFRRAVVTVLVASLGLSQPVASLAIEDNIPEPGLKGDVSKVNKPRTDDGVSTWDCIWFGRYWQEDTNGDGHCFSEDTVVTKHDDGKYYDQDGKTLSITPEFVQIIAK